MPNHFITGTDWEQSSGPIISRMVHLTDVWPEGDGSELPAGDKDHLANGDHPAFAIGSKANRPNNLVGVVMTYEDDATLVILNMADKFISRQWVLNVTHYNTGSKAADGWDNNLAPGDPVYVDDSALLPAGMTLSMAPLNNAGSPNPLFGYIWYCQGDYADEGVGGKNHAAKLPVVPVYNTTTEVLLCVMQVNDSGQSSL